MVCLTFLFCTCFFRVSYSIKLVAFSPLLFNYLQAIRFHSFSCAVLYEGLITVVRVSVPCSFFPYNFCVSLLSFQLSSNYTYFSFPCYLFSSILLPTLHIKPYTSLPPTLYFSCMFYLFVSIICGFLPSFFITTLCGITVPPTAPINLLFFLSLSNASAKRAICFASSFHLPSSTS